MVGMSPIQAPGNGLGHVYSFCGEQTRCKTITTVQKHEVQLSTDTGVNDIRGCKGKTQHNIFFTFLCS